MGLLDEWLKRHARRNDECGASRTYVICSGQEPNRVVGYYALSTGSIFHREAPGKVRHNMPDPVPVIVLGRLAVDQTMQSAGFGSALLQDAVLRCLQAAELVGIRAILVHAISDAAKAFFVKRGFYESPLNPMTLMITIVEARAALDG